MPLIPALGRQREGGGVQEVERRRNIEFEGGLFFVLFCFCFFELV
jgi:hypothetical protein